MTCDIRFLVSGYGNPFETSISLIRADLSAGSFSVEQKFTGLHAPSYLSVHKTDQGTFLYTFEKSGREGKVLAFLLVEKGLQPLSE
jgi:6-phosphogluconolactonase (cycloisomerase 2 family)